MFTLMDRNTAKRALLRWHNIYSVVTSLQWALLHGFLPCYGATKIIVIIIIIIITSLCRVNLWQIYRTGVISSPREVHHAIPSLVTWQIVKPRVKVKFNFIRAHRADQQDKTQVLYLEPFFIVNWTDKLLLEISFAETRIASWCSRFQLQLYASIH